MNKNYIEDDYGLSATGSIDGHDYVDLGLSVKWATLNVGAEELEYSGGYYAWGEVNTKMIYDKSTFKWSEGPSIYHVKEAPKFIYLNPTFREEDRYQRKTLDPMDDVAHVKWGGKWRMPTSRELYELKTYCQWDWISVRGMKGYRVTGQKPGYTNRSIFLPAAGNWGVAGFLYKDPDYIVASTLHNKGDFGDYLCSSLNSHSPHFAISLYFRSSGVEWSRGYSYGGRTVRAVCP